MSLEDLTGTKYINSLVATNPDGATDPKSQGDDHIRGIKNVILKTFPNVTGAVTASQTDINQLTGNTAYVSGGTDVSVTDGGTGASTAADARINLGLGDIAVKDSVANTDLDGYPWSTSDLSSFSAGNTVLWRDLESDTETETSSTSYTKVAEVVVPRGGTLRVVFKMRQDAVSPDRAAYGRIYRNGTAVGTERSLVSNASYVTYSQDIAGWSDGDLLQLYAKATNSGTPAWTILYEIKADKPHGFVRTV